MPVSAGGEPTARTSLGPAPNRHQTPRFPILSAGGWGLIEGQPGRRDRGAHPCGSPPPRQLIPLPRHVSSNKHIGVVTALPCPPLCCPVVLRRPAQQGCRAAHPILPLPSSLYFNLPPPPLPSLPPAPHSIHPGPNGHQVLAELLAGLLGRAVSEVAGGRTPAARWHPRLQGLPPPMIPNFPDSRASLCIQLVRGGRLDEAPPRVRRGAELCAQAATAGPAGAAPPSLSPPPCANVSPRLMCRRRSGAWCGTSVASPTARRSRCCLGLRSRSGGGVQSSLVGGWMGGVGGSVGNGKAYLNAHGGGGYGGGWVGGWVGTRTVASLMRRAHPPLACPSTQAPGLSWRSTHGSRGGSPKRGAPKCSWGTCAGVWQLRGGRVLWGDMARGSLLVGWAHREGLGMLTAPGLTPPHPLPPPHPHLQQLQHGHRAGEVRCRLPLQAQRPGRHLRQPGHRVPRSRLPGEDVQVMAQGHLGVSPAAKRLNPNLHDTPPLLHTAGVAARALPAAGDGAAAARHGARRGAQGDAGGGGRHAPARRLTAGSWTGIFSTLIRRFM